DEGAQQGGIERALGQVAGDRQCLGRQGPIPIPLAQHPGVIPTAHCVTEKTTRGPGATGAAPAFTGAAAVKAKTIASAPGAAVPSGLPSSAVMAPTGPLSV